MKRLIVYLLIPCLFSDPAHAALQNSYAVHPSSSFDAFQEQAFTARLGVAFRNIFSGITPSRETIDFAKSLLHPPAEEPWKRDFRNLFAGSFFSNIGSGMQAYGEAMLLYHLTNYQWYNLFSFNAALVLVLVLGAIFTERAQNKHFVGVSILRTLPPIALSVLVVMGKAPPSAPVLLGIAGGAFQAIGMPIMQRIIRAVVDGREKHEIDMVMSFHQANINFGRTVGPALGLWFASHWGLSTCFLANGISFAFLAYGGWLVRARITPHIETTLSWWKATRNAFVIPMRDPRVRLDLQLLFLVAVLGYPLFTLLPTFLGTAHANWLSWMQSSFFSGAFMSGIAGILVHKMWSDVASHKIFWQPVAIMGIALISFAMWPVPGFQMVMVFLVGAAYNWMVVRSSQTTQSKRVPGTFAGRASSVYYVSQYLGQLIGAFVIGNIAEKIRHPIRTLYAQGLLLTLWSGITFLRHRRGLADLKVTHWGLPAAS